MELPPELVRVFKAYSMHLFRYVKEYIDFLREFGKEKLSDEMTSETAIEIVRPPEYFLPPELVRVIKAYSMPLFRYVKEYKDFLREIGKTEWPDLKAKLTDEMTSETAIEMVRNYLISAEYAREKEQSYYKTKEQLSPLEQSDLREVIRKAEWRQYGFHRGITVLIKGEIDHDELRIHMRHRPYDDDEPN